MLCKNASFKMLLVVELLLNSFQCSNKIAVISYCKVMVIYYVQYNNISCLVVIIQLF